MLCARASEQICSAIEDRQTRIASADQNSLRVGDLPVPHTNRWVIRRKAEVVAAIGSGLLPAVRLGKGGTDVYANDPFPTGMLGGTPAAVK
jgi:hypothetical protein